VILIRADSAGFSSRTLGPVAALQLRPAFPIPFPLLQEAEKVLAPHLGILDDSTKGKAECRIGLDASSHLV
jgi:hypothetical protein